MAKLTKSITFKVKVNYYRALFWSYISCKLFLIVSKNKLPKVNTFISNRICSNIKIISEAS